MASEKIRFFKIVVKFQRSGSLIFRAIANASLTKSFWKAVLGVSILRCHKPETQKVSVSQRKTLVWRSRKVLNVLFANLSKEPL